MEREEALKIIEANCRCSDSKLREACAFFIPELRESEDERIREAIIMALDTDYIAQTAFNDFSKKDMIAWLEKQGEQKPAWSKEMGGLCLDAVELLKNYGEGVNPKSQLGIKIERAAAFLTDLYHEAFYPNTYNPRPDLKLAAWSEEDENNLNGILDCYKSMDIKWRNWLRFLKDRFTWKPSDEQMNALNYVVNLMASSERPTENDLYYNILKSLRQQLKKLKE